MTGRCVTACCICTSLCGVERPSSFGFGGMSLPPSVLSFAIVFVGATVVYCSPAAAAAAAFAVAGWRL